MKKIFSYAVAVLLLCANLSGCAAPFIIGGALGAMGAIAVSKDTIQADTDKPYDSVWESAMRVTGARGTITKEDKSKGYIDMENKSLRVYIRISRLTRSTIRMKISARKHHMPNIEEAQDIFTKIMEGA